MQIEKRNFAHGLITSTAFIISFWRRRYCCRRRNEVDDSE